jgi:hypothetical protein
MSTVTEPTGAVELAALSRLFQHAYDQLERIPIDLSKRKEPIQFDEAGRFFLFAKEIEVQLLQMGDRVREIREAADALAIEKAGAWHMADTHVDKQRALISKWLAGEDA